MTEARESFWVPLLEEYETAGVLRPGLDHRAVVRWITYQEFWLLTHPTVLCDNDEQLTEYIREFVIAALVREPAAPPTPSPPNPGRPRPDWPPVGHPLQRTRRTDRHCVDAGGPKRWTGWTESDQMDRRDDSDPV